MPVFIMLSTLGPEGSATITDHPERIKGVNAEVEALGVKVLHQYAVLGNYDFVNILDAPDERTMARVAMMLAARGTLKTHTLTAIPIDDFITAIGGSESSLRPPQALSLLLGPHVVGRDVGRQHAAVRQPPHAVAVVLNGFGDLETPRPALVEFSPHLDLCPRL